MSIFTALDVFYDDVPRTGAMNMAIDEALLGHATRPIIRFYKWRSPALSFGYFSRFLDVEEHSAERDIVRRWTGGGIVFHGSDVTYSIIVPAADVVFQKTPRVSYEMIHSSLREVLLADGEPAELASVAAVYHRRDHTNSAVYDRRDHTNSAVIDRRYSEGACFANPVRADVLLSGRKIAGAAQRRTRAGLLHQGSIQNVKLGPEFPAAFAARLCGGCEQLPLSDATIERAERLVKEKYGTVAWLRRR